MSTLEVNSYYLSLLSSTGHFAVEIHSRLYFYIIQFKVHFTIHSSACLPQEQHHEQIRGGETSLPATSFQHQPQAGAGRGQPDHCTAKCGPISKPVTANV